MLGSSLAKLVNHSLEHEFFEHDAGLIHKGHQLIDPVQLALTGIVVAVKYEDRLIVADQRKRERRQRRSISSDLLQHLRVPVIIRHVSNKRLAGPYHLIEYRLLTYRYSNASHSIVRRLAIVGRGDSELP